MDEIAMIIASHLLPLYARHTWDGMNLLIEQESDPGCVLSRIFLEWIAHPCFRVGDAANSDGSERGIAGECLTT